MLRMSILFLVIALVAALMGYAGIANLSWEAVRVFFFIFLILAALAYLGHGYYGRAARA
jgi:uncharacterized membrane protein YtjA (UPF0391 family)